MRKIPKDTPKLIRCLRNRLNSSEAIMDFEGALEISLPQLLFSSHGFIKTNQPSLLDHFNHKKGLNPTLGGPF